jgi:poly-beta-1,6-N-acetyl-D-glucosamine synthase
MIMHYLFWISFGLVLYTYLGYPLLVTIVSASKRLQKRIDESSGSANPTAGTQSTPTPFVSLIIAAHNEQKVILQKIKNSLKLIYPHNRFEIVLVSDGSTDATNQIIESILTEYETSSRLTSPLIRFIQYQPRQGKSYAINRAVEQAQGELLVFSDANVWYAPDVIMNLTIPFADTTVGCVCGKVQLYSEEPDTIQGEGLYSRYEQYLQRQESKLGTMVAIDGAMFAIRRRLFTPIPVDTIVDDFYLALNCIYHRNRIVFTPNAIGSEEAAISIAQEVKRKIRMIAGGFQTLFRCKWLLNPVRNPLVAFEFISHKLLRWLLPFFLIILFTSNAWILLTILRSPITKSFIQYFITLLFIGQLLFYGAALVGSVMNSNSGIRASHSKSSRRLIYFATYFCAVNWAALAGLFRYLTHQQKVTWDKITR